jgi:hypothetical protein
MVRPCCGPASSKTFEAAEKRERTIYGTTDAEEIAAVLESHREFIELCERKERETGEPCRIRSRVNPREGGIIWIFSAASAS